MRHALTIRLLATALALAATTTAGCTPASKEKPMVEYRQNPAPKQAYRVRMTIDNAPGEFRSMKALAQYDVTSRECLSPPKDNPGGRSAAVPTEDVEIPLKKIGENAFEGVVYADAMLDEDYAGNGVCKWELIQFRVHMKATGADVETLFIPSIPSEKLLPLQQEVVYFNKITYPRAQASEGFPNTGISDRSRFDPSIKDTDLFTVTFVPTKED